MLGLKILPEFKFFGGGSRPRAPAHLLPPCKQQSTQYKTPHNKKHLIQRTKYEAIALRLNPGDRCAPVCWHGFHELGIKTGKQANSEIQIEGHGDIQIEKYTSTEIQETETLLLKIHMDTGRKTDYTQQIKQYIVHNVRSGVDIQIQMGGRSKQG